MAAAPRPNSSAAHDNINQGHVKGPIGKGPFMTPERLPVRNPRTGEIDHHITPPSPAELDALATRLRAAQTGWAARSLENRIAVLRRFCDAVDARAEALRGALLRDTGRLRETEAEVTGLRPMVERWAQWGPQQLAAPTDQPTSIPFLKLDTQLVPYPLVGVISPWNFPLLLSLIDAVPALVAGCAVLVKPSEVTPRFVEPLEEALAAVPELAEVLGFITGDGRTGAALIDRVDLICFTGSVATGRKVAVQAAERFIPAFLELGGKDPAIILKGTDLDRAARALAWGGNANAGQACQSIERIYVEAPIHDAFVAALVARVDALRLAHPGPMDGEIGPLIFERQAGIIERHLEDALARGAVMRCGHGPRQIDGGWYVKPIVLTGVTHEMAIMREESFGPILPVMQVADAEEAVRRANDSVYGLSGAVFAGDLETATAVAQRIEGGGISVNDTTLTAIMQEGEKMSFKLSGLGGSRMGPSGIRRFLRSKVLIRNTANADDPWWFG